VRNSAGGIGGEARKKALLFEERNKIFCQLAGVLKQSRNQMTKALWFFFSKKHILAF
jgi:hypothetical protein